MNKRKDIINGDFRAKIENLLELASKVVASEHAQMPKTCPKCGGKMKFRSQKLIIENDFLGDELVYECEKCGYEVVKRFPFPPDYAAYFRS